MANLVIVAIPSENDRVWDISSEKVPHMTLLFLGEMPVQNFANIANFVGHAARQMSYKFGLEVDRRGKLGEDDADVLFFSKAKWGGYEDIATFRASLLQNDSISSAYHSVEQFPEWIPHLTLGHPETPARPEEDGRSSFYYVNFDRIALWFNDYDGFEFPLKDRYLEEVMMSDDRVSLGEEATSRLLHYGVKGMKWGVRRKRSASSRVTVTNRKNLGLKAVGGAGRGPSADAKRAKVSGQIAKKSGYQALSNKELKAYIARMDLEKKAQTIDRGNSFVSAFLAALATT